LLLIILTSVVSTWTVPIQSVFFPDHLLKSCIL
jgi:hypothetical protein